MPRPRHPLALLLALILLLSVGTIGVLVWGHLGRSGRILLDDPEPREVPSSFLVVDAQTNEFLMYVSIEVQVGDRLLTPDNRLYKVVRIRQNTAYARPIGTRGIPAD